MGEKQFLGFFGPKKYCFIESLQLPSEKVSFLRNFFLSPRWNKQTNLQGLGAQDVKASNFGILQAGKLTELLNYSQEMTP